MDRLTKVVLEKDIVDRVLQIAKLLSPSLHDFLTALEGRARRIEAILSEEGIKQAGG